MATEIFQPTRPLRGATLGLHHHQREFEISTHAPLAGRDIDEWFFGGNPRISTHAPLAGRDTSPGEQGGNDIIFQPTRPLRGATLHNARRALIALYFNPRAPCGARR